MEKKFPEQGFYYHYKHNPDGPVGNYAYEVVSIGYHTEVNEGWRIPMYIGVFSFFLGIFTLFTPSMFNSGNWPVTVGIAMFLVCGVSFGIVIGRHLAIPNHGLLVLYRPLYEAYVYKQGKYYYVRPVNMFMESVHKNGVTKPRFQKVTDPVKIAELQRIKDAMYG